ncbi:MAG: hypothetical protein DRO04_02145, partial [Candidatus Iainarchaeum archaeon]
YSGADIAGVVREAALIALKENNMKPCKVEMKHLLKALEKIGPSLTPGIIESYKEFKKVAEKHFRPGYAT